MTKRGFDPATPKPSAVVASQRADLGRGSELRASMCRGGSEDSFSHFSECSLMNAMSCNFGFESTVDFMSDVYIQSLLKAE